MAIWIFGVAAYGCVLHGRVVYAKLNRWTPARLLIPIGQIIFSIILLRSMISCWQNQGIIWRGTHYPLQQFRDGQRVKL